MGLARLRGKRSMKKLLALLLLSPLVSGEGFNFDIAKELIIKDLDKLTSLKSECVGFYFEKYNKNNQI